MLPYLEQIIKDLISSNPDQAASVHKKPYHINWFVDRVYQFTHGKGDRDEILDILKKELAL